MLPDQPKDGVELPSRTASDVTTVETRWVDKPAHVDRMRSTLAYSLIALLGIEIIVGLVTAAIRPRGSNEILAGLETLLAPMVGLVGAVAAFYYARKHG